MVAAISLITAGLVAGLAGPAAAGSAHSGTTASTGSVGAGAASPLSVVRLAGAQAGRHRAKKPPPPPLHYTPPRGVRFNNPMGGKDSRRRIIGHLIRTIDSVPSRGQIRIASWNVRSNDITDALARAHMRGVSVRIVMDRFNANPRNPNDNVKRLISVFKTHEKNRKQDMKSRLRECVSACRYRGGIAHTKFFLFSQAGKAKDVIMYGSANATDLAAYAQWNDLYTLYGKADLYDDFESIFDEMIKDRNVPDPYRVFTSGKYTAYFYPDKGPGSIPDPVLDTLNKVQCTGATGGTGTHGRTKIRIAQDAMYAARGLVLAKKLRSMYEQGCDIKIVYSVFGNNVLDILRHTSRGGIPLHQIAADSNKDGLYDRYLHMKNMAISGVYNGQTDAQVVWNGSANWTSVALASDEIVMQIVSGSLCKQYSDWVDYLYTHQPPGAGQGHGGGGTDRMAAALGIDPYALIKKDL